MCIHVYIYIYIHIEREVAKLMCFQCVLMFCCVNMFHQRPLANGKRGGRGVCLNQLFVFAQFRGLKLCLAIDLITFDNHIVI